MGRLKALLDSVDAVDEVDTVDANTPATGGRLAGLLGKVRAAQASYDVEAEARDILRIAEQAQAPLAAVEDHYAEIKIDRDWLGNRRTGNREDLTPEAILQGPVAEQVRRADQVGVIESIQLEGPGMYAARRTPVLGAGVAAMEHAELAAAAARLRDDAYEGAVKREQRDLGILAGGIEGAEPSLIEPKTESLHSALRERDRMVITNYLLKQQEIQERGQTFLAETFDAVSYMPAWMIEFALTGGLAKLGSETAAMIGARALRGYAMTEGGQAVLRAAGWTGGAISRTTLGLPLRVGDEIVKRRIPAINVGAEGELTIETPPESWASAIVKGWATEVIEAELVPKEGPRGRSVLARAFGAAVWLLLPITGYFGTGGTTYLAAFGALWLYLAAIGEFGDVAPRRRHLAGLAAVLLGVLLSATRRPAA